MLHQSLSTSASTLFVQQLLHYQYGIRRYGQCAFTFESISGKRFQRHGDVFSTRSFRPDIRRSVTSCLRCCSSVILSRPPRTNPLRSFAAARVRVVTAAGMCVSAAKQAPHRHRRKRDYLDLCRLDGCLQHGSARDGPPIQSKLTRASALTDQRVISTAESAIN